MITYRIDGAAVSSMQDFYDEIGRAVGGPGGYFGTNLDALADCLRGGYGTPADEAFEFELTGSAGVREHLDRFDEIVAVFADEGVPLHLR
ncbi:barstar family protein [Williamsia deligens]|uniref:Barstar family protein n=1 Tax=Williamsia deligens TaxID=321325 RepID=A0ABW3G5R4_9NOCA|nr:barstar family protein [Williamsia deligens]MCP2193862.1 Barstar, RNAse (barnase) inhibitor [Williamsia deligens]